MSLNNDNLNEVYIEMEKKLFSKIDNVDNDDFLFIYVNLFKEKYVKKTNPGIDPIIIRDKKNDYQINLNPSPGKIKRKNYEFEQAIMEIYNREYWLIKLWLKMYNDAKEFKISRELVRSFIKNCINVTTQELVDLGEVTLSRRHVNSNELSGQADYYIKIFNVGKIMSGMRTQQRDLLIDRSNKNKWSQSLKNKSIDEDLEMDNLKELFNNNEFSEYAELIEICQRYKKVNGISLRNPFLKTVNLFFKTSKGKRAITREIKRIINGG